MNTCYTVVTMLSESFYKDAVDVMLFTSLEKAAGEARLLIEESFDNFDDEVDVPKFDDIYAAINYHNDFMSNEGRDTFISLYTHPVTTEA